MRLGECFKKSLLVKIRPSSAKARQSLAAAKSSLRKARDNLNISIQGRCPISNKIGRRDYEWRFSSEPQTKIS